MGPPINFPTRLLTGKAFFIIIAFGRRRHRFLHGFGVIIGFLGPLNGQRAAIIQAFDALLPSLEMNLMQVPLMNIGGQKYIQRLRLVNQFRAVAGEINNPAPVPFKSCF